MRGFTVVVHILYLMCIAYQLDRILMALSNQFHVMRVVLLCMCTLQSSYVV